MTHDWRRSTSTTTPTSAPGRLTLRRQLTASAAIALFSLLAWTAPAGAAEVVMDGGFEATSTEDHSNPYWEVVGGNAFFGYAEDASHGGLWVAGLDNWHAGEPSPAIQQTITIPADRATRLSFWRRFAGTDATPLLVKVDDITVDTVTNDQAVGWVLESVDLSQFADGSSHVLRFERAVSGLSKAEGGAYQSVHLDDVSLFAKERVPAVVVLAHKPAKDLFFGAVHAERGCAAERTVVVKRVKRGADPTIGRATTRPDGTFKVSKHVRTGRYYAVAQTSERSEVLCLTTKSLSVRVSD